jgi:hypothetical protein
VIHVSINPEYSPREYENALAEMLKQYGRPLPIRLKQELSLAKDSVISTGTQEDGETRVNLAKVSIEGVGVQGSNLILVGYVTEGSLISGKVLFF